MAPFRNVGTFYTEDGERRYTPCCYRAIPSLKASHWHDTEIADLRRGLAGVAPLHKSCEECLSYGELSTAKLYEVKYGTLEYFGFDPETGRCNEKNLTSSIYVGPKCNLGCRMCSGHVSTTFNYVHKELRTKPVCVVEKEYEMNVHNGVTSACVAGGEPLMIDQTAVIVQQLASNGNDSSAFIITNGSVSLENNHIYDIIKKHKKNVWMMMSLDADFETHRWIRIGLDVELMKKNIITLHQDGILKGFNVVVSKMNWNKFLFPIQYAAELGIECDITFLNTPDVLSCKHVPVEDRKVYAAEVIKWVRENRSRLSEKTFDVVLRSAKALVGLPYEGSSDQDPKYIYLTRDI
jgi:organic radical activating enzyme